MTLQEANDRLDKKITEEQLWGLNDLYILLDLHKDYFCDFINAVGSEQLLKKQKDYEHLMKAKNELERKERYLEAKEHLRELEFEKSKVEVIISNYEGKQLIGHK